MVGPGVGRHLATALRAAPFLGRNHQLGADALPPKALRDVPAFEKPDTPDRATTVEVYPVGVCLMTLVVGSLFIRETKGHRLDTSDHPMQP